VNWAALMAAQFTPLQASDRLYLYRSYILLSKQIWKETEAAGLQIWRRVYVTMHSRLTGDGDFK